MNVRITSAVHTILSHLVISLDYFIPILYYSMSLAQQLQANLTSVAKLNENRLSAYGL